MRAGSNALLNAPKLMSCEQAALATGAEAEALGARDQRAPASRSCGGLPFDPGKSRAGQRVRMLGDEGAARERSPANGRGRRSATPGCSAAMRRFRVQRSPTTLSHPSLVGEMAEVVGGRLRPVAAMVVGVDRHSPRR